jgi:ubiquinone/menaquinone biosynthesis C-methylase UbiE
VKRRITIERIPAPFASLYEKAARLVVESYYIAVAQEVTSFLKQGVILDLGTGPGYLPIEIVKRSPSIRVDGIDLSSRLIKMAQANAQREGFADRLHFETGNAAQLRFEEASYDMVISTGMLHVLRDPVKVLKECYRILKPEGEAWIYDPARVSSHMDIKRWKASLTIPERFMYLLFALFTRMNPPHRYLQEQVGALIAATPFKIRSIKEEKEEIRIKLRKPSLKT